MNIEQLNISKDVTDSAYFVMKHAKYVTIDEKYLQKIVPLVRERFKKGFDSIDESFGSTGDLKKDINIIYFETAANFCFWSQNEKTKWKVKHNKRTRRLVRFTKCFCKSTRLKNAPIRCNLYV